MARGAERLRAAAHTVDLVCLRFRQGVIWRPNRFRILLGFLDSEPTHEGRVAVVRASSSPGGSSGSGDAKAEDPGPVKKKKRRRCLGCQKLYYPHPRTRSLQRYCSGEQEGQSTALATETGES